MFFWLQLLLPCCLFRSFLRMQPAIVIIVTIITSGSYLNRLAKNPALVAGFFFCAGKISRR